MYYKYNDNELIYLIKEGNSLAFDMLYQKYYPLMFKVIKSYKVNSCSYEDLIQEARMKLLEAIKSYSEYYSCSFFKYYTVILARMLSLYCRYNKYDSKYTPLRLNEESDSLSASKNEFLDKIISLTRMMNFKNEIEEKLFSECVIEGFSLHAFCKKYSVEYYLIRVRYNNLINQIKKILTIS